MAVRIQFGQWSWEFERKKTLSAPQNSGRWLNLDVHPGAWQQDYNDLTQRQVLANPTVYACVDLISNTIANLPINVTKLEQDVWTVDTASTFNALLRKPSKHYNRISWASHLVNCLLIHGNAYALKVYDGSGRVQKLPLLNPGDVEVLESDLGEVFYRLNTNKLAGLPDAQRTIPARHIAHFRINPLYHPLVGCAPLHAALMSVETADTLHTREKTVHSKRPPGYVKLPAGITPAQATAAKTAWQNSTTDSSTPVLEAGVEFVSLAMNPQQMETIAAIKNADEAIVRAFNVPGYLVGVGTAPSAQNNEILMRQFYGQTLRKYIEQIELTLDEALELTNAQGVEFDLASLLRLDTASRWDAKTKAIKGGLLTINEARKDEGLLPLEGGDTVYMQQQDFPLDVVAKNELPTKAAPIAPTEQAEEPEVAGDEEDEKGLAMHYQDVWSEDGMYQTGAVVTHDGTLWIAKTTTDKPPGTDDSGWKMITKGFKK